MNRSRSLPGARSGLPSLKVWLGGCFLLWGARLAAGWMTSRPLAAAFHTGALDDRVLFEPGALMLMEVLRLRTDLLMSALGSSLVLLLGCWAALVAIGTAVVALLSEAERSAGDDRTATAHWLSRAGHALPRVALVGLVTGSFALVFVVLSTFFLSALRNGPLREASPLVQDGTLFLGIVGCFLGLAVAGILFDLARAALVQSTARTVSGALKKAAELLIDHPGRIIGLRLVAAGVSALLVVAGAALTAAVPLESARSAPLLTVFGIHRVAGLLLVAVQITWLGFVVRWTARATDELSREHRGFDDRSERSAAPDDPTRDPDGPHDAPAPGSAANDTGSEPA